LDENVETAIARGDSPSGVVRGLEGSLGETCPICPGLAQLVVAAVQESAQKRVELPTIPAASPVISEFEFNGVTLVPMTCHDDGELTGA
jgi:hypothetical protein